MDSEEKYTTWVGNMCKKVGTLCSGIDNIISQESFQYAENELLTAGANVKQFTENQFLTAGANVKQFCSEFMQEVLPEFLKDSLQEKTPFLEDTEICDIPSCEILKEGDDEGHTDELSNSISCGGISVTGLPSDGKEMSLEQNPIHVTLIPSDIPKIEAPEKDDIDMTLSVCGVNQPHDGEIPGQVNLPSPKSTKCQSSYSSAKAGGTAEPEYAKASSSTVRQFAIVSAGFDECKILENEVSSSGIVLSKALNNTTESCSEFVEAEEMVTFSVSDGPGDSRAEQTRDNHVTATGMNISSLNKLMIDHDCIMLGTKKICTASDFLVEDPTLQSMNNNSLKVKFGKGWEFIQTAGFEDHHVESHQPRGKSLQQPLQPRETDIDNLDFCESDWEMV